MWWFFILQQGRWESWTSLCVSKCALHDHMDSWQANHYEIQSENRKLIIQHNLKEFVFEGWHLFLLHCTKNLAWGTKTLKWFLSGFFLFIFGFWLVSIFYSAVKPITQAIRPFEYFYFSSSRLKSGKLNGNQSIHIGEIWFLILQSWNILVAFIH